METFPLIVKYAHNANVEIGTVIQLVTRRRPILTSALRTFLPLDTTLKVIGPATERFSHFFAHVGPQMKTWRRYQAGLQQSVDAVRGDLAAVWGDEGSKRLLDAHIIKLLEQANDPDSPIGRMIFRQVVAQGNQLEIFKTLSALSAKAALTAPAQGRLYAQTVWPRCLRWPSAELASMKTVATTVKRIAEPKVKMPDGKSSGAYHSAS